jgi:hypothetical protein
MAIEGELVDVQGNPLDGAMVTSVGTACNSVTDANGKYDLTCQPGTHKLVMSKQGYLTEELDFDAPERERYKLGKKILVKIPEKKGLFMFSKNSYQTMKAGRLIRKLEGTDKGAKKRAYCLDRTRSEPNVLPAGVVPFFDNDAMGWRPFKLDKDGCAYRDSRNKQGSWEVEYREKPEFDEHKLSGRMKIARINFAPGEYFVADWKGFFVPASDDKHSYTGHWVKIGR